MPQHPTREAAVAMTRYLTHYPQKGQLVSFVYAEHALLQELRVRRALPETRKPRDIPVFSSSTRRVGSSGMRFALFFGSDRIFRRSY